MDMFGLCRSHQDFKPLSGLDVSLDLRYAGPDNITGDDLYRGCGEAWLHWDAYNRLEQAVAALARRRQGWKIRVYDAARPLAVQARLFAVVRGTDRQAYVADPNLHSVHNYGFAVDAGLQDEHGQELDLGTPFDAFDELAQPEQEARFLRDGRLSRRQLDLRLLLRECFSAAGFRQHPLEWWHFDAKDLKDLRGRYTLIH
jgi:D-alanyl-D-alanine dipeptidase